jgi:hypothetical protein
MLYACMMHVYTIYDIIIILYYNIPYHMYMMYAWAQYTLEIFFKILTMEIVWILSENSAEIQFSY